MPLQLKTIYEVRVTDLVLAIAPPISESNLEKTFWDFSETLENGRANYILFESLVRRIAGLHKTTGSDHVDVNGKIYEQKSYKDPELHPGDKDHFQVSSSNTFGANNLGPTVKKLVDSGKYDEAFEIVNEHGYAKNDFYIVTNTGGFKPSIPLRFMVLKTEDLLKCLDEVDPRLAIKSKVLSLAVNKGEFNPHKPDELFIK